MGFHFYINIRKQLLKESYNPLIYRMSTILKKLLFQIFIIRIKLLSRMYTSLQPIFSHLSNNLSQLITFYTRPPGVRIFMSEAVHT